MSTLSPAVPAARPARTVQRPLSPFRAALLVASATGVLLLFYLYALVSLLCLGILMLGGLLSALGLARVGLSRVALELVADAGRVSVVMLRSLGLRREEGASFHMPLPREDAPELHGLISETAAILEMEAPDEVVLLMKPNAWVRLEGLRRGRGRATLGLGFDLLATLSRAEIAAVIAHEIAHARLIPRGYEGWLFKGTARIHQVAVALRRAHQESESDETLARFLAPVPARLGVAAARMHAAYTRQHEFAADRLSAQVAGSDAAARALLRADTVGELAGSCGWRDRVVRVERGPGFSAWLRERLTPATPQEAARLEARTLDARWTVEDGTHPPTGDRIAALPEAVAPALRLAPGSALELLANADATAARLLLHLEAVAGQAGNEEREKVRAWLRERVRGAGTRGQQIAGNVVPYGALLAFLGVVTLLLSWGDATLDALGVPASILAAGAAVVAGASFAKRRLAWSDREPLPVPPIALWDAAQARRGDERPDGWDRRCERELEAALPAALAARSRSARRRRVRHWADTSYRALARCDYETALAASSLCLREAPGCPEGQVAAGIAGSYFGAPTLGPLGVALGTAGVGRTTSWAVGWAFAVAGAWEQAEPYLMDAAGHRPDDAAVHALLARAYRAQGRTADALRSAREAVRLEPAEPAHRLWLAAALLDAGRARSVLEEVPALDALLPGKRDVLLLGLRAHVLMGNHDQAVRCAEILAEAHPGAVTEDALGDAFALGDDDASLERAEHHYLRARAEGFHPTALIGHATVALRRKDAARARELLLAALDRTQTPVEGAAVPYMQRLTAVRRGLVAAGGEEEECRAWWVTCVLDERARPSVRVRLLVYHRSERDAARAATELRDAMFPGLDDSVGCSPAARAEQPERPVVPGVYEWEFS